MSLMSLRYSFAFVIFSLFLLHNPKYPSHMFRDCNHRIALEKSQTRDLYQELDLGWIFSSKTDFGKYILCISFISLYLLYFDSTDPK